MSEVKRYECTDTSRNYMYSCGMEEDSLGDYVKFADYEKLKSQLEKAESVLNKIQWLGHPERATFKQNEGMKLLRCLNCCSAEQANEYFKEKEQV